METLKKIAAIVSITVFISLFGAHEYLGEYYIATKPTCPQPEVGRIYPFNVQEPNHKSVYLTKKEHLQMEWLDTSVVFYSVLSIIVLGGLLNYFEKKKKK